MDSDEIRNRVAVSPVRNFQYGGDHDAGRAHWRTFTSDPEHDAYLLGRHHYNRVELREAIEQYRRAIKLEPDYADAHAAIAATHLYFMNIGSPTAKRLPEIRASINKALALDPTHRNAIGSKATVGFFVDLDYQASLDAMHDVVAQAPDSNTFSDYDRMLFTIGCWDVRLPLTERWVTIDPLNPEARVQYGSSLMLSRSGRTDEARLAFQRARDLGDVNSVPHAHYALAVVFGDIEALPQIAEEFKTVYGRDAYGVLPQYYYAIGDIERSRELARAELEISRAPVIQAQLWMLLGEPERALAVYEQGLDERQMTALLFARERDIGHNLPIPNFRKEPGFERLLKKVKLDDESVAKLRVQPLPY